MSTDYTRFDHIETCLRESVREVGRSRDAILRAFGWIIVSSYAFSPIFRKQPTHF